jgi:RNA polymerase sigma factor (sigma-70 family)
MSAILEPKTPPIGLRRHTPTAKLPERSELAPLSAAEMAILRRRVEEPAECVIDPIFYEADAEATIFGPDTGSCEFHSPPEAGRGNDDSSIDLLAITEDEERAPDAAAERALFRQFNYCRFRVLRAIREYRGKTLTLAASREILRWEQRTRALRCELVRQNMALVLAMVKRTKITGVDQAEMVSEGNLALLRSVDKFDSARGFKFSTYACRSILKAFSRVASRTSRYRGYFPTEFDPALEKSRFRDDSRKHLEEDCMSELRSILGGNMAHLNEIERTVIRARYAIEPEVADSATPPRAKTLEQVGELIGVTKERVRQIQNKALVKLRLALEEGVLQP